MTTPTTTPATPLAHPPLALDAGNRAAAAAARVLFARERFDERTVAGRLGGNTLFGYARIREGRTSLTGAVEDANAALIRMLVDTEPLDVTLVERLLGGAGLAALEALGVVRRDGASVCGTVLLTPVAGLWMANEIPTWRGRPVAGEVAADIVFPAISDLTREFVACIPDAPGARVAELCAGTGIGALRAMVRGAGEAWATDIGARSVEYARFNAALNGFDAVTCAVSDGWAAFGDETFDIVCAHPPYLPSLVHEFDYRDGGADGEHVSRRVVEGLPRHLRPGGRATLTCALTDRAGAPVEERLQAWLGAAASEFDVTVVVKDEWNTTQAWRSATGQPTGWRDYERWMQHFESLGIESFALSAIELRRRAPSTGGRAPVVTRRVGGDDVDAAAVAWCHDWASALDRAADPMARLAGVAPRAVGGVLVDLRARTDADGDCVPYAAYVRTSYPVAARLDLPPGVAPLFALCDGRRDVAALHAELRRRRVIRDDIGVEDVARLVEMLAAAGALDTPLVPLPPRPEPVQLVKSATSSRPTQSTRQ
jgi:16S rRNA G966 N2-methylase RsmD